MIVSDRRFEWISDALLLLGASLAVLGSLLGVLAVAFMAAGLRTVRLEGIYRNLKGASSPLGRADLLTARGRQRGSLVWRKGDELWLVPGSFFAGLCSFSGPQFCRIPLLDIVESEFISPRALRIQTYEQGRLQEVRLESVSETESLRSAVALANPVRPGVEF